MSRSFSRLAALVPGVALAFALAGCDVPSVPVGDIPSFPGGGGSGPTLTGSLTGVEATGDVRVGLLGASKAGAARKELVSTAVNDGAYSLTLPASPRYDFMSTDNESFVLALTAYEDVNGNGSYDSGDNVLEAAAESGTFRYFTEDGPSGSYQAGWNLFENGRYTQNFSIAFDLTTQA